MLGEVVDALGEERDLHLGRTGVGLVEPVLADGGGLVGHTLAVIFLVPGSGTPGDRPRARADCGRAWQSPKRSSNGTSRYGRVPMLVVSRSCRIPLDELEWRFSASGGPGGQHANTSNTRAEVRFDVANSPSLGPRQRARLLEKLGPVVRVVADDERSPAPQPPAGPGAAGRPPAGGAQGGAAPGGDQAVQRRQDPPPGVQTAHVGAQAPPGQAALGARLAPARAGDPERRVAGEHVEVGVGVEDGGRRPGWRWRRSGSRSGGGPSRRPAGSPR